MTPSALPVVIRALTKDASDEVIEKATDVLSDAFKSDIFMEYLVGGHKTLLPDIHRAQVRAALIGGKVYVAETESAGIVGTAVWFAPGEELLGSEGQAEAGFNRFMGGLSSKDPDMPGWWMQYFLPKYATFTNEALGDPKYKLNGWHLQLLGVSSDYQRKGVGTELIHFVEAEALKNPDLGSRHLSVETETEGGRAFYMSIGFVQKGETTIDGEKKLSGTVPMFCLAKELA